MKKYIISAFTAAASVLMLGSCTDDLDQMPHIGDTPQTVYSTIDGYRGVCVKILSSYNVGGSDKASANDLSSNHGYDMMRNLFMLQEVPTDECAFRWLSGDNLGDLAYITWDATQSFVSDSYYRLYHTIAVCNDFIRNSENIPSHFTDTEREEVAIMAAEARFFRAMSYAWVLDLFHQGPFVDHTTPNSAYIPECYDGAALLGYIESELNEIAEILPTNPQYAHPGKGAVYALQSRVFLNAMTTAGVDKYSECVAATKNAMALGYSLEPDFAKLFNADNYKRTNEIIYAFEVDHENCPTWGTTTNLVHGSCGSDNSQDPTKYGIPNGWGNFRMRGEYCNIFGDIASSTDSRCLIWTDGQSQYLDKGLEDGASGYHSEKWTNLTDNGEASCETSYGVDTDYPVFRYAEVLLNGAEAVLRGGQGMSRSEALELVNMVRGRAYGDASGNISDAQFTLDFMLDERGREFCFESLRRSDLVRHNKFTTAEYIWQWKGGVIDGKAVDAKYNCYPIPASEISANPNLKNPLY